MREMNCFKAWDAQMASKKCPNEDIGSIRWAKNAESSSSVSGDKSAHNDSFQRHGKIDRGEFSMDVKTFERNLQEKRDRQLREQSPRIEIRLRETSSPQVPSTSKIRIVRVESGDKNVSSSDLGSDEVDFASPAQSKVKRVITYEKILKTKSIRSVSRTFAGESPIVQRTNESLLEKSSSTEENAEDSAYHSHRVRIASIGTPSTISISSSSNSLQYGFMPDDGTRERMFRAGSEPPPFSAGKCIDIDNHNRSSVSSASGFVGDDTATAQQKRQFVSAVSDGNDLVRRHFQFHRNVNDSDDISPDWYNEYQTQTVLVDRPHRMDFKRSNSQYDNHIRQIRGIHLIRS